MTGSGRILAGCTLILALLFQGGCGSDGSHTTGTGMSVVVSGQLRYQDREYDSQGFTGARPFKPIRFAEVEVVRESDAQVLAAGSSDADGLYSMTFTNSGTAGVYVRVLSRTSPATQVEIVVKHTTLRGVFAATSEVLDDRTASSFTVNLEVPVFDSNNRVISGPFNILDVLTDGAVYVRQVSGTVPSLITVFWEFDGSIGTFFDPQDDAIYLFGGGVNADSDEYDDAVILHEYAHFIAVFFSRDDSPGGIHFITDNTQDIRLAWSEGWAHFLSSIVRGNSTYIDTIGGEPPQGGASFFDIEIPSPAPLYSTNELAVAAVLWDIFDTTNESFDALSMTVTPIWDVFTNYLCNTTALPTCPHTIATVSLEDFWDGWFIRGHALHPEMEAVVSDRQIDFFPDAFEDDDAPGRATPIATDGTPQRHTLSAAADVDYVSFTASAGTTYTLETFALANGADTFLEVLDTDGATVLDSNDDDPVVSKTPNCGVTFFGFNTCPPNDTMTLSSQITFTAPSNGTFFARISRSPDTPPSAGVYGTYQFHILSP